MVAIYVKLIRWAFTRFYREFAWTYDAVAALVSANQWRAWTLTPLPYLRGRVLELGCGTGNLQQALAGQNYCFSSIGLDASPQMLALVRRKLGRDGIAARLVRADARALPFPPATFDTLVATFPSEYIAAPATLSEARRVLRPSGRIVIALAAHFAADGHYERLVDLLYRLTLQRSPRAAPSSAPDSIIGRRLAQAGFGVRELWEPSAGGQVHLIVGTN